MMRNPRRFLVALVSALFVVASACQPETPPPPTSFTFDGGGFGHGVGMSQYGALGRAQAGHGAADILAAYFPGSALEARTLGSIRVHLADASSTDLVNPSGPIYMTDGVGTHPMTAAGQALRVSQSGGIVTTQNLATEATATARGAKVWFSSSGAQTIAVSATGKSYRHGRLQTSVVSGKVRLVESDLPMEQYLYGLAEVPTSWPIEALKAQAIAGRSYAAIRLAAPKSGDFDIYSTTVDQVYSGTAVTDAGPTGATWQAAVDQTAGLVLTHGGKVVQAYYSSSNGGHTERPDYVWSSSLPYLHAAPDPYDAVAANPNASWQRTYTAEELGAWIAAAGYGNVGVVTGFAVRNPIGASGRVDKAAITVTGTGGTATLTGNQLRSAINNRVPASRQLRSTLFTIAEAAPVDVTPPDLRFVMPEPLRYDARTGRVCAIVASSEPTIFALSIKVNGVETKSPVGGVGADAVTVMCWDLPARSRVSRPTRVQVTAVGLDGGENYRFVQQSYTLQR